ncbi:hypothetical protein B0J11DRAFT_587523 [Dendryphion nanum]|uniref:Rhodopsin domain-containing protein n=1 Tax=Dendryphion nanum TaxID=256645 RepID=A0A9P9EK59_9PLEO|nr:hypothetical protein B0J11DRAFT_587523 [Dendryphion nanum]
MSGIPSEHSLTSNPNSVLLRAAKDRKTPVSDYLFALSSAYLIATLIVQIIAVAVFFARVYTRIFPWRFRIDDYLISISFVLMSVFFSLHYRASVWALGFKHPPFRTTTEIQNHLMLGTISIPFWGWSTGLIKIAIACMLIRFQQSRRWIIFLYCMIVLNVLLICVTGIASFTHCLPYQAQWDIRRRYPNKKCWSRGALLMSNYLSSVCNASTDIIFSLMPLTFLGKVRRPLKERVVIGGLMGLGILASAFSLSRAIATNNKVKDPTSRLVLIGLLSCLEIQLSLIAACVPTLRSSSRRFFTKIGLLQPSRSSSYRRYREESSISGGPKGVRRKPRDLHHIESTVTGGTGTTATASSKSQTCNMDDSDPTREPVAGCIDHNIELKAYTSQSNLNQEWRQNIPSKTDQEPELTGSLVVSRADK